MFGRGPDFTPHEDFLERQVLDGVGLRWQVVGVTVEVVPLATRVEDILPSGEQPELGGSVHDARMFEIQPRD